MSLEEKPIAEVDHISQRRASNESLQDGKLLAADVRPAAERRLVRMLDMRLLPTIIAIFIMNYIDVSNTAPLIQTRMLMFFQRVAVTAARLKGLSQDLGLSGTLFRNFRDFPRLSTSFLRC